MDSQSYASSHTKCETCTCETGLRTYGLTHAVEALLFSVELHRRGDDSGCGVDVEVFPVPVAASGLQETVAHLSIHSLVSVCCIDLVHWQARRLLLRTNKYIYIFELLKLASTWIYSIKTELFSINMGWNFFFCVSKVWLRQKNTDKCKIFIVFLVLFFWMWCKGRYPWLDSIMHVQHVGQL